MFVCLFLFEKNTHVNTGRTEFEDTYPDLRGAAVPEDMASTDNSWDTAGAWEKCGSNFKKDVDRLVWWRRLEIINTDFIKAFCMILDVRLASLEHGPLFVAFKLMRRSVFCEEVKEQVIHVVLWSMPG